MVVTFGSLSLMTRVFLSGAVMERMGASAFAAFASSARLTPFALTRSHEKRTSSVSMVRPLTAGFAGAPPAAAAAGPPAAEHRGVRDDHQGVAVLVGAPLYPLLRLVREREEKAGFVLRLRRPFVAAAAGGADDRAGRSRAGRGEGAAPGQASLQYFCPVAGLHSLPP